jgi:hypothetical protein
MASKYLGSALMSIGQQLPQTVTANRQMSIAESERLRKQRIEEEQQRRSALEFEQAQKQYTTQQADIEEARRQLGEYQKRALGLPADQSRYQLGQSTGLPRAAAVLPQAKGEWESIAAEEKSRRDAEEAASLAQQQATSREEIAAQTSKDRQAAAAMAREDRFALFGMGAEEKGKSRQLQRELTEKKISGKSGDPVVAEERANDILSAIEELENHPGLPGAVGLKGASSLYGLRKEPVAGTKEGDFAAQYDNLKSLMTMGNIGLMKGVLSDSDMKILASAASPLTRNMSNSAFRKELVKIKAKALEAKAKIVNKKSETISDEDIPTQVFGKAKFIIESVE